MDQNQGPRAPFSFAAAAASRPRLPVVPPGLVPQQVLRGPRQGAAPRFRGAAPAAGIRLKSWPRNKDPRVLNGYLQDLLRYPKHRDLLVAINRDGKRKRLVLMRGLPGSGKSTLAIILAGLCDGGGGLILSADDYFMDRNGEYTFNPVFLPDAHLMCKARCESAMMTSSPLIVIDNTNTEAWEMVAYVELAMKNDYEIHLVEPETPWRFDPRVLCEKNTHYVPFNKIKTMKQRYQQGVTVDDLKAMVVKAAEEAAAKEEGQINGMLNGLVLM